MFCDAASSEVNSENLINSFELVGLEGILEVPNLHAYVLGSKCYFKIDACLKLKRTSCCTVDTHNNKKKKVLMQYIH